MKAGDLVRWNYFGQSMNVGNEPIGVIVSDYYDNGIRDEPYKNVYWLDQQWVRPIKQQYLEVISESR